MKELSKKTKEKKTESDKKLFSFFLFFAAAMIFFGIITAIILGIMNGDLDRMKERNNQLEEELTELDKLSFSDFKIQINPLSDQNPTLQ